VPFDKLVIPYAGSYQQMSGSIAKQIRDWDGKSPKFISYQVEAWKEMRANRIVELRDQMEKDFPGKVEFVRADHYFNLHNEAQGLPFNLCMSLGVTVKADGGKTDAAAVLDGSPSTLWTAAKAGKQELVFDLGESIHLSRCVIRHAGDAGMDPAENTRTFAIQTSMDGKKWMNLAVFKDNKSSVTDFDFPPVAAKAVRILIDNPGGDSIARLADLEVYGVR
jgi:hypothetical protein